MPMKLIKMEKDNKMTIERVLHARRDSLTLDRKWCTGCELCTLICPREAIKIQKNLKLEKKLTKKLVIVKLHKRYC